MYIDAVPGKLIYELREDLAANPQRVAKAQALTQDTSRPNMGLSGENGLFGSKEWWESVDQGRIEVRIYTGTIQQMYVAGQDADEDSVKDFEYICDDGQTRTETCAANDDRDLDLYRTGATVAMAYALDRLKIQQSGDGGPIFLEILLEVVISCN